MKTAKIIYGVALALMCGLGTGLKAQNLYVVNAGNSIIGEYGLDGSTVAREFLFTPEQPRAIAISGNHLFVANFHSTIGEYGLDGSTINSLLAHGPGAGPPPFFGIAISGNDLFLVDGSESGNVSEYTTSGETVNASLISGVHYPYGIAISGTNLFVTSVLGIREYTTSGETINASFISGLNGPKGIAISGNHLFVTNSHAGTIGEYGLDGSTINASLISGLNEPWGIVISGDKLFVANNGSGTIGEYTTSGATVKADLITGLNNPTCIAIGPAQ